MLDKFNREVDYLRISVTDKCNLRCIYCMPEEGIPIRAHKDFLSFEQIIAVVEEAAKLGFKKIRLTGGEPLVKKGIVDLVRMISEVDGIDIIGMTTNGLLLDKYAVDLKKAGLSSLNVSLDTIDAEQFRVLTRNGDIEQVFRGLEAAKSAGFPIKINMVVMAETPQAQINTMQTFCDENGYKLQMINHYSLNATKRDDYKFDRPPKCAKCDRIRLLADGSLKPCLHFEKEIKVDLTNISESLKKCILAKPETGEECGNREMFEIGG